MYRKEEPTQIPPSNFELPFQGKLSEDNRWVIMASLIPWAEFEEEYATLFSLGMGAPALGISGGIRGINNQRKARDKRAWKQ
jgi:IS5 family transposase